MHQQLLGTPVGRARLDWFPARSHRATLVLGHGTATGVEAADLQALAATLPAHGFTVVLVTQPYRMEDNPRAADPASLDQHGRRHGRTWPRPHRPDRSSPGGAAPDRRWPAAPRQN